VPDFFVVGHAKCGTTAMYEMLRRHPQVFMPEYHGGFGKEPWFFSRENPQPQRDGHRDVNFTGRPMPWSQYLALFDDAREDQLVGEGSTSYLWSHSAASRIAAVRPDARIVAIIREPASFLRSLHLQLLENRHEIVRDFRTAVELDGPRLENREIPPRSTWPGALIYSERIKYVEQLERYRSTFGADRLKILIYDDFRRDNAAAVHEVQRFLGIDEAPVQALDVNPTGGPRGDWVVAANKRLRTSSGLPWRTLRASGKALTSAALRKRVFYPLKRRAIWGPPPPPDEEFMQELRRRFKPEVLAFSEYMDRDLISLWGYDDVG
jgi:hypothetical protein